MKLRVARATNDLKRIAEMYSRGLGFNILGGFENHEGFDGVMLGTPSSPYHFEFTYEHGAVAPRSNSSENLLVFYLPSSELDQYKTKMTAAGFTLVKSHNPYWDKHGITFEDFEGYRVLICGNDQTGR